MREHRYQIFWNLAAFCLLLLVSIYRKISLNFLNGGKVCNLIVFFCYMFLIIGWCLSLIGRLTQKSLLYCLLLEALLMMTGLTGRFLQDTFFFRNTQLMRSSGLVIGATLLPIILLGIFAAMGMGQTDQYHLPWWCFLLWIPILVIDVLLILDDRFHVFFRTIKEEDQPNLYFHPGWGFWILILVLAILVFLRAVIIFKRNHLMDQRPVIRLLLSVMEIIILVSYMVPYIATSMYGTPEIIETYAMLYYVEALTWEFYIGYGLVPANTAWREVFSGSTLDMQILPTDESSGIYSSNAEPIPDSLLKMLNHHQMAELPDGTELHRYLIPDADVIFRKDTRLLKQTLKDLDQVVDSLEQESDLLARELQAGNRQTRLKERENIYTDLRLSVSSQLERMNQMIDLNRPDADVRTLQNLCILGTYVKRKCNLLLLREERGVFNSEDLLLSITNLIHVCRNAGMEVLFIDDGDADSEENSLFAAFETMEALLELHNFQIRQMLIRSEMKKIILALTPDGEYAFPQVQSVVERIAESTGSRAQCTEQEDSYLVTLSGGDEIG